MNDEVQSYIDAIAAAYAKAYAQAQPVQEHEPPEIILYPVLGYRATVILLALAVVIGAIVGWSMRGWKK